MTDQQEAPTGREEPQVKSIDQVKAEVCKALQNKFSAPHMRERLLHLARGDESLVVTNLNSFLTIIANDEGSGKWNQKKYLCQATTSSLSLCFLEAMQLGIPIDRRGLVHVVVYDRRAELEIDYKGFIYYLSKHYDQADFDVRLVFEGDKFRWWSESGDDKYEYRADESRKSNDYKKVNWAFCFITYVKNNREHSRIEVMDRRELDLVRSKAKTKNVWDEWTGEMYKKAVVRRACKLPLAAVDENAIESVDNKNFELDRPAALDRLQLLMEKQKEITDDEKPGEESQKNDSDAGEDVPAHESQRPDVDPGRDAQKGGEVAKGRDAAPAVPNTQEHRTAPDDSGPPAPREISDADFEEVDPAAVHAAIPAGELNPERDDGLEEGLPAYEDPRWEGLPADIDARWPGEEPAVWDGKTLNINGKPQTKDFADAAAALEYLKKVMVNRKHAASRKAMIEENSLLIAALIRSGNGNAVGELHKLAAAGIPDAK